jgi:uncharacterized protein YkwD
MFSLSKSKVLGLLVLFSNIVPVTAQNSAYNGMAYYAGPQSNLNVAQMLDMLNQVRASQSPSAPTLIVDKRLKCAAEKQCGNMATTGTFDHDVPGYPKLGERVKSCGFTFASAAENLYMDNYGGKTENCQKALENSPGHFSNMLYAENDRVGFAICDGAGGDNYWVQVFGREMGGGDNAYAVLPGSNEPVE